MGQPAAPHAEQREVELAPLTDAGGEVEILVSELQQQSRRRLRSDGAELEERGSMPWWCVAVLIAAVFAVSSAGSTFALVRDVPAFRLGAWRLQLTTALLSPLAVTQYLRLPPDLKARTHRSFWKIVFSGACAGVHFGAWVFGIQHTSLIHAYLFVSVTPLVIALGTLCLRKPISGGELFGTFMGVAGAAVLTLGPKTGHTEATVAGDMSALLGAISIIGYLEVGRDLRLFMPIFAYAVPVTGVAAFILTLASLALEDATLVPLDNHSIVGYLGGTHILPIAYLAVVPGIVGHQGLNTALKYISPLAISLSTATEPVIGAGIGYVLGVAKAPSLWMYLGGALIISATLLVTGAAHRRQSQGAEGSVKRQLSFSSLPTDDDGEHEEPGHEALQKHGLEVAHDRSLV